MRRLLQIFLVSFIGWILAAGAAGSVTDEYTVEEWKTILAVGEGEGRLTGLQITLSIDPDRYYLPVETPVNLSGELFSIFGPLEGEPVIISHQDGNASSENQTLITGEDGKFSTTVVVNRTVVYRFQAWFEGSDLPGINLTKSREVEMTGVALTSVSDGKKADDGDAEDLTEEDAPEESPSRQQGATLSLEADAGTFSAGQNTTLSGYLRGYGGTPLPHRMIAVEMRSRDQGYSRIGSILLTDTKGRFTGSYHLTGPDNLKFRALTTETGGERIESNPVSLTFRDDTFDPPARIRYDERHIDAFLTPSRIRTGENITLSGWFSDGSGEPVRAEQVNLYWYNFMDRIWDRYEAATDAITGRDGNFAINVTGPDLPGVTYMAVVSRHEENGEPLFSRALTLSVRNESEPVSSLLAPSLQISGSPVSVRVGEPVTITVTLTGPDGIPIAGAPLLILFSTDGFTWYMSGADDTVTGPDGLFSFTHTPDTAGFSYFRGVYNSTASSDQADSGILVIPVTDGRGDAPLLQTG